MAAGDTTVTHQNPSAFSLLITAIEDPRHTTMRSKKQSSLKRGSNETSVKSTSRKKERREIPQPPKAQAKRKQGTSKEGAGIFRKPSSFVSPGLVDASNDSRLSSTRKESIMERGVMELHKRAEGDCDFAQAIPKLLSSKYPSSCLKCGKKSLVVREVAEQAAVRTSEQRTAEETSEHRADKIFFACAAVSCGVLYSSFAAFYEGEYRKMRVEGHAEVSKTSGKEHPEPRGETQDAKSPETKAAGQPKPKEKETEDSKESGNETQGVQAHPRPKEAEVEDSSEATKKQALEPRKSCEPLETVCQCIFPGCGDVSYSSTVFCAAHGGTRNGTFPFPWLLH